MHDAPLRPALWQSLTAGAASHTQSLHRGWQWGQHAEFLPDIIDTEDVVLILSLLESRTSLRNLLAGRVGTPCSLDCRRRFVCSVLAGACYLRLCFPSQNTLDEPVALFLLVRTRTNWGGKQFRRNGAAFLRRRLSLFLVVSTVQLQICQRTRRELLYLLRAVLQKLLKSPLTTLF
jgi:hypothetical protein